MKEKNNSKEEHPYVDVNVKDKNRTQRSTAARDPESKSIKEVKKPINKKKKKDNIIPPTQRVAGIPLNPLSGDREQYSEQYRGEQMSRVETIKRIVKENFLNETAYGKATIGAPKKPRRMRRATKPSSFGQRLVTTARNRAVQAQQSMIKRRQQLAKSSQEQEKYMYKQKELQHKLQDIR